MMKTDDLESKLLKLFSREPTGKTEGDWLIEETGSSNITIEETVESGKGEVTFKNGRFIRFSVKLLGTNKFISFFNRQEGDALRKTCDGIFLARIEDRTILCLVELKSTINNNFRKAIRQIEGSYLRTALLLSLITDIKDIEPVVFIAGGLEKKEIDPDREYLERTGKFRERENDPGRKLKEFSRKGQVKINFPFFLDDAIHQNYHKKNIKVTHLDFDADFDMQTLISGEKN